MQAPNDSLLILDQQSYIRNLRRRAFLTIGLIALVVLIGTVIVQLLLQTQNNSGSLLNRISAERLQAEELVLQLLTFGQLNADISEDERSSRLDEIETSFRDWQTCCGDEVVAYLIERDDAAARDALINYQRLMDDFVCLIAAERGQPASAACSDTLTSAQLLIDFGSLAASLRTLVAEEQAAFDNGLADIRTVSLVVLVVSQVLLFGMTVFVLSPALVRAERFFNYITETRNRLSTSETRFRHMAENIDEAFWIMARDESTIYYVNPAYEIITGMSPLTLMNDPASWQQVIHPDDQANVDVFTMQSIDDFQMEYRIIRMDGEERWVWHRVRHIVQTDQGVPLTVSVVMDITDRKRFEVQMQQAREAAEAASNAKTAFLANMSHELRTPLNAILGFAQLLQSDVSLTKSSRDNVDIIINSGEHLLALINDVLDMSRIEAGKVVLEEEEVDLFGLLDTVNNMFAVTAQNKGLNFQIDRARDLPAHVRVDGKKLRQIMINLVGNAVKFTDEGGVLVRVRCEEGEESRAALVISVEDTGPGIDRMEIDHLFDTFRQTRNGYRKEEGTGLGLPISQTFAQVMRGRIEVKSHPGTGTTFHVTVPVEVIDKVVEEMSEPPRRVVGIATHQPEYRILVVDDNANSRLLMQKLLGPLGFAVKVGVDGQEGVQIAGAWAPHMILMDMRMPKMDGYEATRRIRAQGHDKLVIIGLTASVFDTEEDDVIAAGCDVVLRKPFQNQHLFTLLEQHLGVEFSYAEEEIVSPTREVALTAELLQSMPEVWRNTLLTAAHDADAEQVRQSIEEIAIHHAPLADALTILADNFEFDRLAMLLGKRDRAGD